MCPKGTMGELSLQWDLWQWPEQTSAFSPCAWHYHQDTAAQRAAALVLHPGPLPIRGLSRHLGRRGGTWGRHNLKVQCRYPTKVVGLIICRKRTTMCTFSTLICVKNALKRSLPAFVYHLVLLHFLKPILTVLVMPFYENNKL